MATPENKTSAVLSNRFFKYDEPGKAAIEAQLAAHRRKFPILPIKEKAEPKDERHELQFQLEEVV